MRRQGICESEQGAALVISLMFLTILALVGSTAVVLTTTDMQIGKNYLQYKQAFYQADAGVQFVKATIEGDLKNGTTNVLPSTVGDTLRFTATPSGYSSVSISDIKKISDSPNQVYMFTSTSQDTTAGYKVQIAVQFKRFNQAFEVGILSDSNITIHGAPNIAFVPGGGMHANGNLTQMGAGIIDGNVSAHGTVNVGSAVSGTETSNADTIDVPLVTASDFSAWRTKAQTAPNIYSPTNYTYSETLPVFSTSDPYNVNEWVRYNNATYQCIKTIDFTPAPLPTNTEYWQAGDPPPKIVFVDGNISVSGNALQNVTIIATGNITVNGSSNKNWNDGIGTAMIAGGDITFNGSSQLYGAFWCNGDFKCNGAGTLVGGIVAGGDITRNGAFNFVQSGRLENDNVPRNDCVIISWKDSAIN
jgi:hypothetical protein